MRSTLAETECHKFVQRQSTQFAPVETGSGVKWWSLSGG